MIHAFEAKPGWRPFIAAFSVSALALALVLYGFVVALDPFGIRVRPGGSPAPLMDINQRYMYPQLIRSGRFDGAIFGTSTLRLLDPEKLGSAFGTRLANLAMNAATPWEQMQLAGLFLRHVPAPKLMIFGLDEPWCAPDIMEPANRLTFRSFPPWLYGEDKLAMLPQMFNSKSLEIAGRVLMSRLGLAKPRMRPDGYGVFTPPESRYNLTQARAHIWEGVQRPLAPVQPPVALTSAERDAVRLTTVPVLADMLARVPQATQTIVVFPPLHVAAQAQPGSKAAAMDQLCKDQLAAVALRHGATVLDFRRASPITSEDSNYWDKLHYRVGIADRIVADIEQALRTGQDAPDGSYRVITQPGS